MQNRQCLLILGGGIDQVPGIIKARKMNIYTIVLDGNPEAKGKLYADEFYTVSIKHMEQIEYFISHKLSKRVDGVIAFGVDIPLIIAKTADILGVNHTIPYESAMLSENKYLSKKFMQQNNIATPDFQAVDDVVDIYKFIEKFDLPVIIKPVDNSAARGILYINNTKDIEYGYNYAMNFSKQKKIQVEKFLDGPQISTESFIINGEIYNIAFLDRNYNDMNKFLPNIIENGGDMPSVYIKDEHKLQLTNYIKIISKELNIKDGVLKGDIVIHNNKLYIIEFALRLSGGNFSTVCTPASTGIDFIKIAIKLHIDMKVDNKELKQTKNDCVSMRYKFVEDTEKGIIKKLIMPRKNKDILMANFYVKISDRIESKTTDHSKRLAVTVAKGENREKAIMNAQFFLDNMKIVCG